MTNDDVANLIQVRRKTIVSNSEYRTNGDLLQPIFLLFMKTVASLGR